MAGAALLAGAAIVCLADAPGLAQQSEAPGEPASRARSAPRFAGVWIYNDKESINIQTGRPELGPQAGGRRPGAGTPAPPRQQPRVGNDPMNGSPGWGANGDPTMRRSDPFALTPFAMAEVRGFVRDLLEVPYELTIRLADDAITFVDDLDREMTFTMDGRKQKYQVSASRFEARMQWDGERLRKDIDAAHGFKMNELYFLSEDGRRLFVIIRVGEQRKDLRPVGVNRVYDRSDQDPVPGSGLHAPGS
jgi:hypothetical protein